MSEEFKSTISEYISVTHRIQNVNNEVKALNSKKKELTEVVISYMIKNSIEACELQNGSLILKTTQHFESLKPEFIQTTLQDFFNSPKVHTHNPAQEATAHIMNQREESTRHSLRIVTKK
jgi:hypothetical protein